MAPRCENRQAWVRSASPQRGTRECVDLRKEEPSKVTALAGYEAATESAQTGRLSNIQEKEMPTAQNDSAVEAVRWTITIPVRSGLRHAVLRPERAVIPTVAHCDSHYVEK